MRFEHTDVWGFEHALRGMRNPLESWEKLDSYCGLVGNSDTKLSTVVAIYVNHPPLRCFAS